MRGASRAAIKPDAGARNLRISTLSRLEKEVARVFSDLDCAGLQEVKVPALDSLMLQVRKAELHRVEGPIAELLRLVSAAM